MDTNLNIGLTLSSTEEENKLEIAGNCSHEAGQKCALYVTNIESIPDDVMFDILVRLPAQDIYASARLVCSSWLKIIRTRYFYRTHFQQSTCGLLIYHMGLEYHRPVSVSTQKDQIEISYFNNKFVGCRVSSSCNGLALNYLRFPNELYISNPATMRHFALPPFPAEHPPFGSAAIAYAAASMEYKVFRTFLPYRGLPKFRYCAILTVGVDKDWTRRVDIEHLPWGAQHLLFSAQPLTTEGFVHWAHQSPFKYVLTLNIETEIITHHHRPPLSYHHDDETRLPITPHFRYLSMGSHLSLLVAHPTTFSWVLWIMKSETGEWTNVTNNIDLELEKCTFEGEEVSTLNCRLEPVGWLKQGEVLVFEVNKPETNCRPCTVFPNAYATCTHFSSTPFYIVYNVRTREIDSFELEYGISMKHMSHRNSLVWIDKNVFL